MYVLKKYGTATTILFPLIDAGAQDFESTPVVDNSTGDVQISKDEGAFATATNDFAHEGNGIYSLALTATEMEAATVVVTIIDQTATKAWEDQAIVIDTISDPSAEHAYINMAEAPEKNVALSDLPVVMKSSTDHVTPTTGLTVSGTVSKDGGAFGAIGGSVAEVGNGVYQADLAQADMNADLIILRFTASGADDTFITIKTV